MIYDQLPRQGLYRAVHPLLPQAFDYLLGFDTGIPDGKYELKGDKLFALVQSYETAAETSKKFEAHRNYIDLQYLAAGEEIIYHTPLETLGEVQAYNGEKDFALYEGQPEQPLVMRPASFAILFPRDGHKPGCHFTGPAKVRKVVLKIRV